MNRDEIPQMLLRSEMTDRIMSEASTARDCTIPDISSGCCVTVTSVCSDDLDADSAAVLHSVLDESEQSQLAMIRDNDARRQYLVAHVLLRATLSYERPVKPAEWRFTRTRWGQPIICFPQDVEPLFFSLSHTKSLVVCAVTSTCRVGVDAEKIDANVDVTDLASHVLSEDEQEWWRQEKPDIHVRRFYELWTLKESLFKAVGLGLELHPSCLGFRLPEGKSPELSHLPAEFGNHGEWSFRICNISMSHACALAVNIPSNQHLCTRINHMYITQLLDIICDKYQTSQSNEGGT